MIRPGLIFGLAWVAALVTGTWYMGLPDRVVAGQWMATRDLPPNHQLRDNDLSGPTERWRVAKMMSKTALIGNHLVLHKAKGAPISKADVSQNPLFLPQKVALGVLIYSVETAKRLADGMEIGSWVLLCYTRPSKEDNRAPASKCAKTAVAVEAIHRATSPNDTTWVALRIPRCMTNEIGEYLARETRFLLVAANASAVEEPTLGTTRKR